jgi:hypothetical protein
MKSMLLSGNFLITEEAQNIDLLYCHKAELIIYIFDSAHAPKRVEFSSLGVFSPVFH